MSYHPFGKHVALNSNQAHLKPKSLNVMNEVKNPASSVDEQSCAPLLGYLPKGHPGDDKTEVPKRPVTSTLETQSPGLLSCCIFLLRQTLRRKTNKFCHRTEEYGASLFLHSLSQKYKNIRNIGGRV